MTRLADGRLETAHGSVAAPELVAATGAWGAAWRPLRPRLTPFGSTIVLTEPVPELVEELGWTGGEAIVDARMFIHYFRTTPDGRVAMGSATGPIGFRGVDGRFDRDRASAETAAAGLRRLLPALAEARIERAWGGPIDVSSDHLPFFGTVPGERVHYGAGYTGNGAGPSWLGGQILASLALRLDDPLDRAAARPPRRPEPPAPSRSGGSAVESSAPRSSRSSARTRTRGGRHCPRSSAPRCRGCSGSGSARDKRRWPGRFPGRASRAVVGYGVWVATWTSLVPEIPARVGSPER